MCHKNKWVPLPKETQLKLSHAKRSKQNEVREKQYIYDLNSNERKQKKNQHEIEEIMAIEGKEILNQF